MRVEGSRLARTKENPKRGLWAIEQSYASVDLLLFAYFAQPVCCTPIFGIR